MECSQRDDKPSKQELEDNENYQETTIVTKSCSKENVPGLKRPARAVLPVLAIKRSVMIRTDGTTVQTLKGQGF